MRSKGAVIRVMGMAEKKPAPASWAVESCFGESAEEALLMMRWPRS